MIEKLSVATVALAVTILGTIGRPVLAQTVFDGRDSAVGPGSPLPNSDAAAARFDSAASNLGTVDVIDFENLPLGNFSSLEVAPNVTLTLANTSDRTDFSLGITNDTENPFTGFNTTAGGANFFRFATQRTPDDVETVATATFSFTVPIQAFGAYIQALGEDPDNELSLTFSDGTSQTLLIEPTEAASPSTAQFFGFTAPGKSISSVTLQDRYLGFPGGEFSYIVGVDDVRYVAVPETSSVLGTLAVGVGGAGLLLKRKMNRKNA